MELDERIISEVFPSLSLNFENTWFINTRMGVWGRIDPEQRKGDLFGFAGIESDTCEARYVDVIQVDKELFFLPQLITNKICVAVYNLDEDNLEEISLKNKETLDPKWPLFCSWIRLGDYLFALGNSYPAIVRVDIKTKEVDYIEKWVEYIKPFVKEEIKLPYISSSQVMLDGNKIYIPITASPVILTVDLCTMKEEIMLLNIEGDGFVGICKIGSSACLLNGSGKQSNRLYLYDFQKNEVLEQYQLPELDENVPIVKMLNRNNKTYIFRWSFLKPENNYNDVYVYSAESEELENLRMVEKNHSDGISAWGEGVLNAFWKNEETLVYITGNDLMWHEYNTSTGECLDYKMSIDKESDGYNKGMNQWFCALTQKKVLFHEKRLSLNQFLKEIEYSNI
ncbi:MAG: hypothetical protein K6F30_10205 [Lachnospiraceae bacterium]|nr:hypothetical protein [Lachnospiraceae bacterium]